MLSVSRDAQNIICAITIVGTVLKRTQVENLGKIIKDLDKVRNLGNFEDITSS